MPFVGLEGVLSRKQILLVVVIVGALGLGVLAYQNRETLQYNKEHLYDRQIETMKVLVKDKKEVSMEDYIYLTRTLTDTYSAADLRTRLQEKGFTNDEVDQVLFDGAKFLVVRLK